ncbi:MAG TPA: oligosaccharide flippase family protein [Falsiroseomonas sp.]|jgi:O-antigen/teichoic acid export membrane protein|nr:oligosaccharide flippase family protein [Falsiroseomonas sp.]
MSAETQRGSILSRTAMGAGWMFAWRMTTRFLGLFSTLVLVRLLTPADFGLFSLAFAVIATLETVLATGVEAQLIRARQTSRELYDTVFTMNIIRGVLLALLMLALAAPAATFFREPRLEPVILVLALIPLLGGVANVGVAEFSREMEFGKVFKLLIVPRLLQIVVTLVAAVLLHSHWALVFGAVAGRAVGTIFSYVFHPFRPRPCLQLWRELIGISFWTWTISLAQALRDRMPTFVIGRTLSTRELGIYTVSHELASLPTSEIAGPITQATMPGFAAALRSQDRHAIADAYTRILGISLLVCLPAALGLSLLAGPFVAIVLGNTWLETATLITILAAGYAALPISMIGTALLDAQTKLRQLLAFCILGITLRAGAFIAVLTGHGLIGFTTGMALALVIEAALLTAWCLDRLAVPFVRVAAVAWRPITAVAAMVAVLWGTGLGWADVPPDPASGALAAAEGLLLGAGTFLGVLWSCWWLAKRPPGAEADLLSFARMILLRGPVTRLLPFTSRYLASR